MVFCFFSSGGGYPGGGQHHRSGDISPPPAGFTLHPVLHVQALQQEDKEEEEEGPPTARPRNIIAAFALIHVPRITPLTSQKPRNVQVLKKLLERSSFSVFQLTGTPVRVSPGKQVQTFVFRLSSAGELFK